MTDPFYARLAVLLDAAVEVHAREWPGRPFGKLDGTAIGALFEEGALRQEASA